MSFGGRIAPAENTVIDGAGWPDLSTSEFRTIRRVNDVFDNDGIAMALSIAALNVQGQLKTLLIDDVPPQLDAAKTLVYKRAVYGRAHAELLAEFATQDRREQGNNAATDDPEQGQRFLAQSARDVCLLLGRSPNGIESL